MPFTFILSFIYLLAIVLSVISITKKKKVAKVLAAVLFLIGITLTVFLFLGLKNM